MLKSLTGTLLAVTSAIADPYATANTPIQSGTPHAVSFSPGPNLKFSTSEENKILSAGFGFNLTQTHSLRIEVSTQATGSDYTELAQKWKLENGSKLHVTYQHIDWNGATEKEKNQSRDISSIFKKLYKDENSYTLQKLAKEDSIFRTYQFDSDSISSARKDTINWRRAISKYYRSNPYTFGSVWVKNIDLATNREDISYFGENAKSTKDTYYGYSATASIGYLNATDLYCGASYKFIRSTNPGKIIQLSAPYTENDSLIFITKSLREKKPKISNSHLIGFEVRRHFAYDNNAIGIQLNANYSINEKAASINLPLYFLRDKSQALTGGFDFGWDTDSKNVAWGLFVSKAFDLYP